MAEVLGVWDIDSHIGYIGSGLLLSGVAAASSVSSHSTPRSIIFGPPGPFLKGHFSILLPGDQALNDVTI